jgi:hypothetical protein
VQRAAILARGHCRIGMTAADMGTNSCGNSTCTCTSE